MPEFAVPVLELDRELHRVRRGGKEVIFVRDLEWNIFVELCEAARRARSCPVATLARGLSALVFLQVIASLKTALEPLHLTVIQFDTWPTNFQLMDVLTLEEVFPLAEQE